MARNDRLEKIIYFVMLSISWSEKTNNPENK